MRVALGVFGFLIGAIVTFLATMLFFTLWYDVLRIGDPGGDSLNGFASFMAFAPLLVLAGGALGAFWGVKGGGTGVRNLIFASLALLVLLYAALWLAPMFML